MVESNTSQQAVDTADVQAIRAVVGKIDSEKSKPLWQCVDMYIHGTMEDLVVVLDSGAEVNYLASGALVNKTMTLTPTDIRLFRVDRTPVQGAVKGILTTMVRWGKARFQTSFVVVEDHTQRVLLGSPVIGKVIDQCHWNDNRCLLTSGELVPLVQLKDKGDYVGSLKKGREIKWVTDSEFCVSPSQPTRLVLRPSCGDDLLDGAGELNTVSEGNVGKAVIKKRVSVDLTSLERVHNSLCWSVTMTGQGPFVVEFPEGTVVLRTCVAPPQHEVGAVTSSPGGVVNSHRA